MDSAKGAEKVTEISGFCVSYYALCLPRSLGGWHGHMTREERN
jgi:hypothetical protein